MACTGISHSSGHPCKPAARPAAASTAAAVIPPCPPLKIGTASTSTAATHERLCHSSSRPSWASSMPCSCQGSNSYCCCSMRSHVHVAKHVASDVSQLQPPTSSQQHALQLPEEQQWLVACHPATGAHHTQRGQRRHRGNKALVDHVGIAVEAQLPEGPGAVKGVPAAGQNAAGQVQAREVAQGAQVQPAPVPHVANVHRQAAQGGEVRHAVEGGPRVGTPDAQRLQRGQRHRRDQARQQPDAEQLQVLQRGQLALQGARLLARQQVHSADVQPPQRPQGPQPR
mmetsp:Transcript_2100/g.6255  ORF Transcript_2100/g.6255 Transcript_2100/m.6255 type:complete len:284 (-) Transcript_2100:311-1162(-)